MKTSKIKKWMLVNYEDFVDNCGILNATKMAEDACHSLNGYENFDIPEEFFEAADDVNNYLVSKNIINE